MRRLLLALLLLLPTPVLAQVRPGAFTTVTLTDTTADALHVGCAVGSSTCTGGIKSGAILVRGHITNSTNNTYDLGESARRWRKVWTTDLDVSGTLTAGSVAATTLSCTGCVGPTEIAATAVSAGSYGSASAVGTFTVDADGRLTAAANVSIALAGSAITSGTVGDGFLSSNIPLKNGTNAFTGTNTFAGITQKLAANVTLTCDGATTDQNVNVGSVTTVRFTTAGAGTCILGGVTGGADGRFLIMLNATGQELDVAFDAVGSTAANRIASAGAGTLVLSSGTMSILVYDATTARWRPLRGIV